jgi:uncharacterized SAM-binding protein YcdF (DUF218 family)
MRKAVRRSLIVLAAAIVPAVAGSTVYGGRYLDHEDPLRQADALFVLGGSRMERPLEAADLYREGYAPLIALSPESEEPAEVIARTRGIPFPRKAEVQAAALIASGIPRDAFVLSSGNADSTAAEGALLRSLTTSRGWRTVIVVTSKYHTRRAGFAMRRALAGTGVQVVMRASRYDPATPERWWHSRGDIRYFVTEWQKLIAYRLGVAE